jgi:hypothetical protein
MGRDDERPMSCIRVSCMNVLFSFDPDGPTESKPDGLRRHIGGVRA